MSCVVIVWKYPRLNNIIWPVKEINMYEYNEQFPPKSGIKIQRILYTIWFLISNDNVRFVTLKIHSDAIEVATVTACILYNDFTVISLLLCALKCKCNVAQIHCMAVHAFEVLSNSRRYNVNIANIYFCFVMQNNDTYI